MFHHLFSDDASFCSGHVLRHLKFRIELLKVMFDRNKLSLNLSKTSLMLFGDCNRTLQRNVKINVVERVTENKFLRVTIESLFKFYLGTSCNTSTIRHFKNNCRIMQSKQVPDNINLLLLHL